MLLRLSVQFLFFLVLPWLAQAQDIAGRPVRDSGGSRATTMKGDSLLPIFDSTKVDSLALTADSLNGEAPSSYRPKLDIKAFPSGESPSIYGGRLSAMFKTHPFFHVDEPSARVAILERRIPDSDWIFYLFSGLLIFLGFIRLAFPKYFSDLFRVFFNSSLRQQQIREQLLMDRLPSMLLNIYFGLSAGVFLYFLLRHYGIFVEGNRFLMLLACSGVISIIYIGKYVFTELAGLIFDRRKAAELYSFVIFMVNKMIGLFLLPGSVLLVWSPPSSRQTVLFFIYGGLMLLLIYRLARGYMVLRNGLKINQLQFLIYVVAFELVPVLLVYKLLMRFF
jgi:hypothetical protein